MLNACRTVTPTRALRLGHFVALCHISAVVIPSGDKWFPHYAASLISPNRQKFSLSRLVQYV